MFPPLFAGCAALTAGRAPVVPGESMSESQNERWLTYVELGELLRCTPSAARMHARRKGWQRRTSNMIGEQTRVRVPGDAAVSAVQRHTDRRTYVAQMFDATDGQDQANSAAVSAAVAVLREQLTVANRRIDDLTDERKADAEERRRLLVLLTDLADARAAAEINRNLAAGLQRELGAAARHPPVVATVVQEVQITPEDC